MWVFCNKMLYISIGKGLKSECKCMCDCGYEIISKFIIFNADVFFMKIYSVRRGHLMTYFVTGACHC